MKAAFFACEKSNLMIILLCEQRGQTEDCNIFGLSFLLVLCFLNELLFAGEMIFSLSIFNS